MTIEVYAQLKEYFGKAFEVTIDIETISSLREYLSARTPEAAKVLESCRFAVDNEFVDHNYLLKENDRISIIPPSSGG